MIAFIAHTAPEDIIPSKNQLTHIGDPNSSKLGEKTNKDKKNPPQVEKHIGQDSIPEMNSPRGLNGEYGLSPQFEKKSLNLLKIEP